MKNKHNYLKFENVDVVPPSFPDDTWKALKKTIHEAAVSYENDCYLATAILCGKIIETLLKRAYYVEFDEDPDSAGRQRGGRQRHVRLDMPEIRKKLYEREFLLEPALDDQLNLISRSRNTAAHGPTFIPDKEQATAVNIYTSSRSVLSFRI